MTQVKDDYQTCLSIMRAKKKLQQMPLKMTGHNSYNKYDYFELKDITEPIIECLLEEELANKFFFTKDKAILRIYSENGYCEWETPLKYNSTAVEKAMNGKDQGVLMKMEQMVQTYARRTLWLQSMEVIEHIELEETETNKKPKQKKQVQQQVDVPVERVKEILDQAYTEIVEKQGKEFNLATALWTLKELCKTKDELTACKQSIKTYNAEVKE